MKRNRPQVPPRTRITVQLLPLIALLKRNAESRQLGRLLESLPVRQELLDLLIRLERSGDCIKFEKQLGISIKICNDEISRIRAESAKAYAADRTLRCLYAHIGGSHRTATSGNLFAT